MSSGMAWRDITPFHRERDKSAFLSPEERVSHIHNVDTWGRCSDDSRLLRLRGCQVGHPLCRTPARTGFICKA